ncbi:purine-nucleoside phosphorylase [Acidiluteibacter ferrifornacis]|uniref:Purine nucleoside phosphorylase n=1 Tax=Acidiluteibacter ferrifornacis TaxID=2692424 RepID=A0A6N9NLN0_9FLAO|nr:purine-nucleoside phosphorylase [Acidiluteibacter ferrifornacis]NBG66769.1 purine-nucleoside phosphorylase [Acidiluteibacter ferrifornacis]
MLQQIQDAANFIQQKITNQPTIAIVLGSGLGDFGKEIKNGVAVPYEEIPHFPKSTVEGHKGQLLIGEVDGVHVIALQGRFHYYEGYTLQETTFPIRVFKALGIENLLLSNASGGLNPEQRIGDLMVITDHIHLFPDNPLRGVNIDELGPRFPDMSEPYSLKFVEWAKKINEIHNLELKYGVYAGVQGPTYETKAEYKYLRIIGADAVGMSTTAETIVAVHSGMKVFGVSIVSDLGVEGKIVEISHEEVQEIAKQAGPKMNLLFKELIKRIGNEK